MRYFVIFDLSRVVCRVWQVAGALTKLILSQCGIDDAGATTLGATLRYTTATHLLLLCCMFDNVAAFPVATRSCSWHKSA